VLITVRVADGVPSLRGFPVVEALRATFKAASVRDGFCLVHYSIQRDHVHMIVEADDHAALGRGMKSVVSRIAHAVKRVFRLEGSVMAGRYHARRLESPRQVYNALRYVLLNSRKHCRRPGPAVVDEASSGRWFEGFRSHRPRVPGRPKEVAAPATWLLATGWKRHGLIGLEDVPGQRT